MKTYKEQAPHQIRNDVWQVPYGNSFALDFFDKVIDEFFIPIGVRLDSFRRKLACEIFIIGLPWILSKGYSSLPIAKNWISEPFMIKSYHRFQNVLVNHAPRYP